MSKAGGERVTGLLADAGPQEAFYVMLMCAVCVDGSVGAAEQDAFNALIRRSRMLAPLVAEHQQWWSRYRPLVADGDGDGFDVEAVKRLAEEAALKIPHEIRVAVFAQACDLAFADADFAAEEQWLIRMMAETFELPFDQVRQIVEVLSWKNAF